MKISTLATASILAITSFGVQAAPFTSCPSKAFLFQDSTTTVFGVNLATGISSVLQDNIVVPGTVNAVGFNDSDRYIYGFSKTGLTPVRVNKDFEASYLNVTGLPSGIHFYVGDTFDNHYYIYHKSRGFYKIDLSPLQADENATLTAETISTSNSVTLTDFAFHPTNNKLYGVDNNTGILYEFDTSDGSSRVIGDTGVTGTFGAAYFDVDGYLYISRNNDGYVFRIDLGSVEVAELDGPTAILFAYGPSSSQNDGARCANAPIIDEDEPATIDFGDAPASYGTLIQDNGARHALDGETYLGLSAPSGKYNGPDNSSFEDADDDGVGFITPLETGLDSVIQVIASKAGRLNAWIDWNQDGDFDDEGEGIFVDTALEAGSNILVVRVPEDATAGNTWSRFRFSTQQDLQPSGGSINGEVEDYAVSIASVGLTYTHYPAVNGWTTVAYEDNWPETADYDMNDVVMGLRVSEVINTDTQMIERIDIRGRLLAMGGSYHSGFAIRLPGIASSAIDTRTTRLQYNDITQASPLEEGRSEAIFIIHNELNDTVAPLCGYFRTPEGCDQDISFSFDLSIAFSQDILASALPAEPYDPFIFGTENYYHGSAFPQAPGRGLEIHLADQSPTEAFNSNYFGLAEDTSNAETGRYYRTANNLPWAMEMSSEWQWPLERVDLVQAYPIFVDFVLSDGELHQDWHLEANGISKNIFK